MSDLATKKRLLLLGLYTVSAWAALIGWNAFYNNDYSIGTLGGLVSFFMFDMARKFRKPDSTPKELSVNIFLLCGLFFAMGVRYTIRGEYFDAGMQFIVCAVWLRAARASKA